MRKRIAFLMVIFSLLSLAGCSKGPFYDADDFIGKTSLEITSEFGSFDCTTMPVNADGLYKNCKCGYTIKKTQKTFLGTSAEILFFVVFDEKGIAIECEEDYRPGA